MYKCDNQVEYEILFSKSIRIYRICLFITLGNYKILTEVLLKDGCILFRNQYLKFAVAMQKP